jgi:hypothetical protein
VPYTGADITAALRALHQDSVDYWATFTTPVFFAPIGNGWSAADNVRHLTKVMRAVGTGLRTPRWLLRLRFGGGSASRGYAEMKAVYLARLARGASAGRFTPAPAQEASDLERARIMSFHAAAVSALIDAIGRWPDTALDARKLPHPLLGAITVREMLFFTLYHNRHHLDGVRTKTASAPVTS